MKEKKIRRKKHFKKSILLKLFSCTIYLIVMCILAVSSFKLYEKDKEIVNWKDAKTSDQYTYMEISRMSEKFAYDPSTKKGYHFVISKEENGLWHTYIIAINEDNYNKYKDIIDYTYERTQTEPKKLKIYGYPVLIENILEELALKNIKNFLPADNKVEITKDNFTNYLTNSYLDTTNSKVKKFNYVQFILMIILVVIFILFIYTIFSKEKTNNVEKIERKSKPSSDEKSVSKKIDTKQNKKVEDDELEII